MAVVARVVAVLLVAVMAGCEFPHPEPEINGTGDWDGQLPVSSVDLPEICLPVFDSDSFEYTDGCGPDLPSVSPG
jgi:hypothetical protein